MRTIMNGKTLSLGTCYYPEHWEKEDWAPDLERMLKNGIETIRIAEFAWNLTEPEEGVYTFDYWQEFLDLCAQKGMKVIFCTPTATAPAWLSEKYPEILNRDIYGNVIYHGMRQQNNFSSPVYREFSRKITEQLAQHFGSHPAIVGWQLDNEFNCGFREYYAESDYDAFRTFLKERYGTLEELNNAWGTAFWNQTYTDWNQVFPPRNSGGASHNPHQVLDFKRYSSWIVRSFAKEQADIIRKYKKPEDFITTNGIFGDLDYQEMMKESLDEITYDSYPDFAYCIGRYDASSMKDRWWSKNLSRVRAIKEPFGIMEQQSGAPGWYNSMEGPTPRPGQVRLWTLQSMAHGADFVSYFRWRTCNYGVERYWHGILDYSGRDNRRLKEIADLHEELKALQPIAGKPFSARVAVLTDYDNIFESEVDSWQRMTTELSDTSFFVTLEKTHTPFNYVDIRDDMPLDSLDRYDLVIYPHPQIITASRTALLMNYVSKGGTLLLGARAGLKDIRGFCTREKLPGMLKPLTGTDVLEYGLVPEDEGVIRASWDDITFETPLFNEVLAAEDGGEVLARYNNSTNEGEPALICKKFGKGTTYYLGSCFSEDTVSALLGKMGFLSPYKDLFTLPADVELAVRGDGDAVYYFLLNYEKEAQEIELHVPMTNVSSGEILCGKITLPKYGVFVLTKA